jgi:hypothetical protein
MSFVPFFSLFESPKPFDVRDYKCNVESGRALAAGIERRIRRGSKEAIPDDVTRAIAQTELIAAIEHPLRVLEHFARYLAVNGEFYAAGKLHATYESEVARNETLRSGRRKAARLTNVRRRNERAQWIAVVARVGAAIRATRFGARLSDSALAKRIVTSPDFISLKVRRPSWNTVRAELRSLKLSRKRLGRTGRDPSFKRNARALRGRMVSRRVKKKDQR